MIRVGVIGAGNHSRLHGRSLQLIAAQRDGTGNPIELVCICDLDKAKARDYADAFGFGGVYTEIEVMLDSEKLDGVIAITPLDFTEEAAQKLLPVGIPLLIEKPPGRSAEATKRLMRIAEQTETRHMVSFNRRFSPAFRWLREWRNGRERCHIEARMMRNNRFEPDFVLGTGIHLIDAVVSLLGTPLTSSTIIRETSVSGCNHYSAAVTFSNGDTAHLLIAPHAGYTEERYEIIADGTSAIADVREGTFRHVKNGEVVELREKEEHTDHVIVEGTYGETEAFIALCEGFRDKSTPDLADARRSMSTAEAIARGGIVEIG